MFPAPSTMREVKECVVAHHTCMGDSERRFLEFALSHPFDVAFGTLTVIAGKAGVSANTAINTLRQLGFTDFRSFRDLFRSEVRFKSLSRAS